MSRPDYIDGPSPRRNVGIVWLLASLVMFAALAPTISRFIASNGTAGGIWVEVCSASGTKLVQVDIQENSTEEPAGVQADHCAFCLPQFQFRFAQALGLAFDFGHQFAFENAPCWSLFAPVKTHNHWRPDRSRAPPAIS